MLKLASLAMAALTSLCVAQSPLNTLTGGTNSGNVGGGLYFDLQVNTKIQITQIDFRCGANTIAGVGTQDVYLGPSTYNGQVTNAALWTLVASAVGVTVAPSTVSVGVLNTPICLEPGTYGIALKSNGYSHGYTNGVTCTSTTIPGACSNSTFTSTELVLRAGAAQNAFLTGGIFSPRIYNGAIHFNVNPGCATTSVASWQKFGKGCYDRKRCFYEFWPSGAFVDFGIVAANGSGITSLLMTFAGTQYIVTPGTAVIQPPLSVSLGLGDDVSQPIVLDPASPNVTVVVQGLPVTTSNVEMCSNGTISFVASNAILNAVIPDPTPFLANNPICGNWKDFDPTQAGASTHYEYSGVLGAHMFTWLACPDFGIAASPNNFQILIYNNGNIEFRWGAMSQLGGGAWPVVMGYSHGAVSLNYGGDDVSARLGGPTGPGFLTDAIDNPPVDLSMSARPILGTTPIFSTTNMEPSSFGGFLLVGFVGTAGTPLTGFGIPECLGYVDLNASPTSTLFLGNPGSIGFGIPNNAGLAGVQLKAQSAVLGSTFNGAFGVGVITSNQVAMKCGTL